MRNFSCVHLSNSVTIFRSSATLGRVPRQGREGRVRPGRGQRLGWAEAGSVSSEDILSLGLDLETPGVEAELYYDAYRPGRRVKRTESFV